MLSLVSSVNLGHADSPKALRRVQIEAAESNLAVAARALPDAPDIESLVANGSTLESALKKLNWDDTDVPVVGSSRFRRTAADLPGLDGRPHPRRRRRTGGGGSARRIAPFPLDPSPKVASATEFVQDSSER